MPTRTPLLRPFRLLRPTAAAPLLALALALAAGTGSAIAAPQFTRMAAIGATFTASSDPQDLDQRNPFWTDFAIRLHQQVTLSSAGTRPFYQPPTFLPPYAEHTNLPGVLTSDAQACLIVPSDSDPVHGHAYYDTKVLLLDLCQQLKDHSMTPILADPLPAAPSQTPERAYWSVQMHQAIAEIAAADSSIITIPWSSALDADANGYGNPACYDAQGQLNREGISRLAQAAATRLALYTSGHGDIFAGLDSLTPNPLMQPGSTGIPGVPADLPSRWVYDLSITPENPAPALSSSVIRRIPSGPFGYWWQLAVSGSQERDLTLRYDTPTSTLLAPGDTVELLADYETGPDVSPGFTISPSLFGLTDPTPPVDPLLLTGDTSVPVTSGTLRSLPFTIPTGQTGVTAAFHVHGAGTFRLGRVNVHRLPVFIPGPYRDDLEASIHGVKVTQSYRSADGVTHVNAGDLRATTIAVWGDSLVSSTSDYRYSAALGPAGFQPGSIRYGLLPPHDREADLYTVTHLNPGGTGPLTVELLGNHLTVTLARTNGVVTSTTAEIRDAIQQSYHDDFRVEIDDRAPGLAPGLATVQDQPVHFTPDASYSGDSTFTWLQALTGQAFDFARRLHTTQPSAAPNPAGDWDFGYPGHTAAELAASPGPAADILDSDARLIVGCAGAYDLLQGATPADTRDRIVALWDLLTAAGRSFVWMPIPPAGDPARQSLVYQTNSLLREAAAAKNIVLLPWRGSFVTGDSDSPAATTTAFPDGVLPSSAAAFQQAQYLLDFFTPLLPPAPRYDLIAPADWITANPSVAVDAKTGAAPGWAAADNSGRLQIASGQPDGATTWEQVKIIPVDQLDPGASLTTLPATTRWAEGDLVEGLAEIRLLGAEALQGISITVLFNGTGGQLSAMRGTSLPYTGINSGGLIPQNALDRSFSAVLRTPACVVPHGTTSISMLVTARGSATYWLRNAGVHRLLASSHEGSTPSGPIANGPDLTPLPLASVTATVHYTGSIYAYQGDPQQPSGRARGGFDSFVLSKTGAYTARGRIDGVAFSLKGKLDTQGATTVVIPLPAALTAGGSAPVTLSLALAQGNDGTRRVTGTLTGVADGSPLAIDLVQTGPTRGTAYPAGLYTATIPADPGQFPATEPQGQGVATFSVKSDGSMRCQYVLPDGTLGTRSAKLSGEGLWQFYFPATGSAAARGGLLAGHVNFYPPQHRGSHRGDVDGYLSWKVPANPRSPLFPAGFDTQRDFIGYGYTPRPRGSFALLDLTAGPGNVDLVLGESPSFPVTWSLTDTVKATGLAARVNRATGLTTGTCTDPASRVKYSLYSVILQGDFIESTGLAKSRTTVLPLSFYPAAN